MAYEPVVEEVLCIRVDGIPFRIGDCWGLPAVEIEAAQCSAGPCLGRHFAMDEQAGCYRCTTCEEPYTVRLIPVTATPAPARPTSVLD